MWKALLIVSAGLICSSCVMYKTYPNDWAAVKTTEPGKCPNLEGTYGNVGTANLFATSCRTSDVCQLSYHLFKGETSGTYLSGTEVRILQPDEASIELRLFSSDRLMETRTLSTDKSEFVCTGEGLEIGTFKHIKNVVGTERIILQTIEDGALVARFREAGGGAGFAAPFPLPIPFGFYLSGWIKWELVKSVD